MAFSSPSSLFFTFGFTLAAQYSGTFVSHARIRRTRSRCARQRISSHCRRDSAFHGRRHAIPSGIAFLPAAGTPVEAGQSRKFNRWRLPAICAEVRRVSMENSFFAGLGFIGRRRNPNTLTGLTFCPDRLKQN